MGKKVTKFFTGKRIVGLGILFAFVVVLAFPIYKIHGLHQEEAAAAATLKAKEEKKERLERELSMVTDPKYIETQAREMLRMIKNGETLYIFDKDDEAKTDENA